MTARLPVRAELERLMNNSLAAWTSPEFPLTLSVQQYRQWAIDYSAYDTFYGPESYYYAPGYALLYYSALCRLNPAEYLIATKRDANLLTSHSFMQKCERERRYYIFNLAAIASYRGRKVSSWLSSDSHYEITVRLTDGSEYNMVTFYGYSRSVQIVQKHAIAKGYQSTIGSVLSFSAEDAHAIDLIYAQASGRRASSQADDEPDDAKANSLNLEQCLALFDLQRGFTHSDLRNAYRLKISEYHPDRVAHLGAKLRELAEIESKRINCAYEILRQHLSTS